MLKRVGLFLFSNLLIIMTILFFTSMIQYVFGINLNSYFNGSNYLSLLMYAGIVGFSGALISLFLSKKMAIWMYNPIMINADSEGRLGEIFNIVRRISYENNIKTPDVGYYESTEVNAFATGYSKNNSLVCLSSSLLETMDMDEIEGVIGHEMAHIINGDMVTMTLLQGLINTFVIFISRILASIIENFITKSEDNSPSFVYYIISFILEIVFTIFASLLISKYSRVREYSADRDSAKMVGKDKMIKSLKKLKLIYNTDEFNPDGKMEALKIGNKSKNGFLSLFSTHPDLDDRINKLIEL